MNSSLPRLALAFCLLASLASATSAAESRKTIELWPAGAPGEKGGFPEERDTTKSGDNLVAGKPVIRLGNVTKPTLTVYRPSARKNTGAAVVVAPGGGYHILAMDLEGTEVCEWLNSIGVTGILLKYRVPKRPDQAPHAAPLQDIQRAMGIVRSQAVAWGIDPKRIGVLGFSAGGHLSAALSNNYSERTYPRVDAADAESCRPDFAVLIYPGGLVKKDDGDKVSPELKVTANTPPTFLAMSQDDGVRVENPLFYYLALKNAKVPAELHLYPSGGHGYGLRPSKDLVTTWPARVGDWMKSQGWLAKR